LWDFFSSVVAVIAVSVALLLPLLCCVTRLRALLQASQKLDCLFQVQFPGTAPFAVFAVRAEQTLFLGVSNIIRELV